MAGIYIHIPFCKQACHYCDFHFSTNTDKRSQMVQAIASEILMQQNYFNGPSVKTIYFGGGTPSLLSGLDLDILLEAIHKNFTVDPLAEVTLEANPDDLSPSKLAHLKKSGINRLSIGIQSFDNKILKFLNRTHDSSLARTSYRHAREAGFKNISIDLIYAIPSQDSLTWKKNIDEAIALDPEHISSYSLTIEPKTVFGKWASAKKIHGVTDDTAASQYLMLSDLLEAAGFDHYEVSNFSRSGYVSAHNSNYWKSEKYLGVGPSAHSYNGETRQFNISNNHLYLNAIKAGKIPATMECLTREEKINDYLLTTLRTSWGTNLAKLQGDHNYDLQQVHGEYMEKLIKNKFATLNDGILVLTKAGSLLADKIASDLFAD